MKRKAEHHPQCVCRECEYKREREEREERYSARVACKHCGQENKPIPNYYGSGWRLCVKCGKVVILRKVRGGVT